MATITVKDAAGVDRVVNVPNDDGRAAAAASRSIALCTEDQTTLAARASETTLAALNAKSPALGQAAMAGSVPVVIASNQTRSPVGILLAAGVARQLAAGASSANTALTAGIRAVSILARGGDIRFAIGDTSQTASSSTHYIASGERLDFDVSGLSTPNIGVIRVSADCTLEVSELS
jgi:hypothetical protein